MTRVPQPKPARKERKLTIKERKFLKAYLATGNKTKAALAAYDTKDPDTASAIARETLGKPRVNNALLAAYADLGITDTLLARTTLDGLRARETKYFQYLGRVKSSRSVIDHNTRHKFLETVHRVKGDFAPEKHEVMDYITAVKNDRAEFGFERPAAGAKK